MSVAMSGHDRSIQAHEMPIRLWFRREQVCNGDSENETKELDLFVRDRTAPRFDAGQDVASHVATQQLKLSDKLVLGPSPLIATLRYVRPNNIAVMMHTDLQTSQHVISLEGLN